MFTVKLFLLSVSEVEKYLPYEKSRRCKYEGKYVWWYWLRSPGSNTYDTAIVCKNGYLSRCGTYVRSSNTAVRPALHLNLDYLNSLEHTEKDCVRFAGREWLVLNEESGLLLSKEAVAQHRFDEKCNDYEQSEIKSYLNGELFNELFTEEKQKLIMDTVINGEESYPDNPPENLVKDKLFLLSEPEFDKYLPDCTERRENTDRILSDLEKRRCKFQGEFGAYWLRSHGSLNSGAVVYVDETGYKNHQGTSNIQPLLIRPALHLNSSLLQSLKRTSEGCVKYGTLEWLVLNEETGLLLAKEAVTVNSFNSAGGACDYNTSEIRDYMNNALFNYLFSAKEQEMIKDTFILGDISYPYNLVDGIGQLLKLGDDKYILAPKEVDISDLNYFDKLEYELWSVLKSYMNKFGIIVDDQDTPDFHFVKDMQDEILRYLNCHGVNFKR